MSVSASAVGVSAELAVVGPPDVGGFDDPAEPEGEPVGLARFWFGASFLDVEFDQSPFVELAVLAGHPQEAASRAWRVRSSDSDKASARARSCSLMLDRRSSAARERASANRSGLQPNRSASSSSDSTCTTSTIARPQTRDAKPALPACCQVPLARLPACHLLASRQLHPLCCGIPPTGCAPDQAKRGGPY